jgi:hypothetical protein
MSTETERDQTFQDDNTEDNKFSQSTSKDVFRLERTPIGIKTISSISETCKDIPFKSVGVNLLISGVDKICMKSSIVMISTNSEICHM